MKKKWKDMTTDEQLVELCGYCEHCQETEETENEITVYCKLQKKMITAKNVHDCEEIYNN